MFTERKPSPRECPSGSSLGTGLICPSSVRIRRVLASQGKPRWSLLGVAWKEDLTQH